MGQSFWNRSIFIGMLFLLVCLTSSPVLAVTGVYPVSPEKGINSISYTISGADSTSYTDGRLEGGSIVVRNYKGVLATGSLRIHGSVTTTDSIHVAHLKVSISLGNSEAGHKSYRVDIERYSPAANFDISVPIPAELTPDIIANGASFYIIVESYYYENYGEKHYGEIQITGHLDASASTPDNHAPTVSLNYTPAQPEIGTPINFTATAADADGDPLSYAWYLDGDLQSGAVSSVVNWSQPSQGSHTLKVVVSDDKGATAEDSVSFTVANPVAKPYVIAPGYNEGNGLPWGFVEKVIINGQEVADVDKTKLYTGSRIKTGPGVEIVLRYSSGGVSRVLENSTFELEVRKAATTRASIVAARLKKGVSEFYWPKGYAGAEKLEVDTDRIVVGIKGTTFTVSHIDDVSTVSVQEGAVQVTNLDTGIVSQVGAGNSLTVTNTGYLDGDYNYYVPYYSNNNGNWTGLGLANNDSATSALTRITVYDQNGTQLSSTRKLIAAGGQESLPVSSEQNSSGWLLVNSHQPLSGLAFIGLNSAQALMADIPFVKNMTDNMVIPHVAQDTVWDTSILLCNPHAFKSEVYFELVDQSGFSQGFESLELPAMGSREFTLASAFANASRKNGKVLITSSAAIAAFALYSNLKSGGSYYAGINAVTEELDISYTSSTYSYYLPYFSSSSGDWTGLALANPDMFGPVSTRITVFNEAGTVQSGSTVSVPIWGQFALPLTPPNINRGWIQVDADGPLSGLAFIGTNSVSALMADIPFVENLSRKLVVPHVAQDAVWDTALLLCNPAVQAASVRIVNITQFGEVGCSVNRTIAAQGSARYELSSIFSGHSEIGGKIEIISSTGLTGFALYSNKKSGGSYFAGINAEAIE